MQDNEISPSQLNLAQAIALKAGRKDEDTVHEAISAGKVKIGAYAAALVVAATLGGPKLLHGADRATEQPNKFVDSERVYSVPAQTPVAPQHP
jgi:hypothetical protein